MHQVYHSLARLSTHPQVVHTLLVAHQCAYIYTAHRLLIKVNVMKPKSPLFSILLKWAVCCLLFAFAGLATAVAFQNIYHYKIFSTANMDGWGCYVLGCDY